MNAQKKKINWSECCKQCQIVATSLLLFMRGVLSARTGTHQIRYTRTVSDRLTKKAIVCKNDGTKNGKREECKRYEGGAVYVRCNVVYIVKKSR